jgi:hypothetical protein
MNLKHLAFPLIVFALLTAAFAQTVPATEYEKELSKPGRTLFRDRTIVGTILLSSTPQRGKPTRKSKTPLDTLSLYSDVSFVPGDTLRYFGATLELTGEKGTISASLIDAEEIPSLRAALEYNVETARNIASTDRNDTRIMYSSKSGWSIIFNQVGKVQQYSFAFPTHGDGLPQVRYLSAELFSSFSELVELMVFDLKRQGAKINTSAPK